MTDRMPEQTQGPPLPGLRERSVRGGLWLAARDSAGTVIRLGSVLVLTALLGPAGFGIYAGSVAVVAFLVTLTQLAVEIYLVKYQGDLPRRAIGTVYTYLIFSSALVTSSAVTLVLMSDRMGLSLPDHATLLLLLASLPVNVLWAPAQAQLERRFAYRQLGVIELIGDLVLAGVSIGLVLSGAGPAGAAAGYLAWQVWLLLSSHVLARTWPVLALDRDELRAILRFGSVMTSTSALVYGKSLVNPLIVGSLLGPVAVGYTALAQRVIATLSIVNRATVRLSYVTLGPSRDDTARLRQALDEGGAIAVAGLAVPLALVCVVAPVGFPLLFGPEWRESADVLAVLTVSAVLSAAFVLPASLLVVQGAQHLVTLSAGIQLALLVPSALVLVPVLGPLGYPVAQVLSSVGYAVLVIALRRRIGKLPYRTMVAWGAAFLPQALTPLVPELVRPALWLPLVVLLMVPHTRKRLFSTPRMLLRVVRR